MVSLEFGSASLRRLAVRVGGALRFSAVYADEGPPASPTLVALHGAPGSHNDFKYLRAPCSSSSLRLLCPDLPGFGFTAMDGQESFRHTTGEKVAFLGAWMDEALEGGAADVLLAHSAGTFPALRLIAQEPERASVLVLVNPGGVRPHKVMRPTLGPALFAWLYDRVWLRPLLRPLIAFVLRKVAGLRVADGDVGGVCAQTISRVGFAEQRLAAARLAASDAHVLLLFGGQDPVVETEVSLELCSLLGCGRPLVHASEAETRAALRERLGRGLRRSAVIFPHDGHYASKTHAALVLTLARDVLGHVPSSH